MVAVGEQVPHRQVMTINVRVVSLCHTTNYWIQLNYVVNPTKAEFNQP